jgi:SAM-dependent methyltransferase
MADDERTKAFLDLVVDDMAGLSAAIMAAIGDRLGIFGALAEAGPSTADEIAARAGLDPRYAREWLGGMTAAGYLHHDAKTGRFTLPPEHVPVLAEEAGPVFMGGTMASMIGALAVLPMLETAMRSGAGIPMDAYPEDTFRHMARDMAGIYTNRLVQEWIPAMPAVRERLEAGASVADVGCGGGVAVILLASAFPRSRFVGYDLFAPNVERATRAAAGSSVADRARFVACDAAEGLPEPHDIVFTFDVVHDAADPPRLVSAIHDSVTRDGRYVVMEPAAAEKLDDHTRPIDVTRYMSSLIYCMSTSLANGGAGLGTLGTPEPVMRELCLDAGFRQMRRVPVKGIHALYEATA